NVRPCKGSIAATAGSHAVSAITAHRTTPAPAESIAAPAGPMRSSKGRPTKRKTTTSAATESDHKMPDVPGLIPALLQRIIAKESCIARYIGLMAGLYRLGWAPF